MGRVIKSKYPFWFEQGTLFVLTRLNLYISIDSRSDWRLMGAKLNAFDSISSEQPQ